jgi:hypothetical protein
MGHTYHTIDCLSTACLEVLGDSTDLAADQTLEAGTDVNGNVTRSHSQAEDVSQCLKLSALSMMANGVE